MKRPILWVPLAVVAVILALFATALFFGPTDSTEKAVKSAMVGQPVPDFDLAPAVAGRPGLSSAALRQGRPHLVNVFASWCIPCRAEAAQLAELARRGVPIDAIAVRDRPEDLAAFLATYGDPFRAIGADLDRRVQMDIGSAGVPETFIVDGRGIIRHQHIGAITESDVPTIISAYEAAR
ncbi:MAG TPA: DsbE family thiol:disulfide interchange protein [Allosphingosinicella sp.]